MSNHISKILKSLRQEYMIIGLTGAVGSGCTESAKFLSQDNVDIESYLNERNTNTSPIQEDSRINIMKTIYEKNEWKNFYHIKVSNILFFLLIFSLSKKYTTNFKKETIIEHSSGGISFSDILKDKDIELSPIIKKCKQLYKQLKRIKKRKEITNSTTDKLLIEIDNFIATHVNKETHKFNILFQKIGASLREDGYIFNDVNLFKKFGYKDIGESPVLLIAKITREIIKLLDEESKNNEEKKHKFYVIDALRNIYEIEFFKNRYESFYLFSILSNEVTREKRILNDFKYKKEDLKRLNDFEKYDKGMSSQAINTCISKGDIFIQNNNDLNSLYYQLNPPKNQPKKW